MAIVVLGLNHKTASISLREKVVFPMDRLPLYLQDLNSEEQIANALLLSTCNRSEIYCEIDEPMRLVDWVCRHHRIERDTLLETAYIYKDVEAIIHIMKVACGLDSMILGEAQILGQVKTAYSESCAAGLVGSLFSRLFQHVFMVAKEVRTNTAIGACPVSVASATVNLVKSLYADLTHKNMLLLGAGSTISLVLAHLTPHLPKSITLLNRSLEHAQELADKYHCEAKPFNQLNEALDNADVVISAMASPNILISRDMLNMRKRPLLLVDIAVPRNIDPELIHYEQIKLYSIDDLKAVIQANLQGREHAAEKALEVIIEKANEFMVWHKTFNEVTTTIRAYRNHIESLTLAELEKYLPSLEKGEDPKVVLKMFAHSLTKKFLHQPSVQLRQAGYEGRTEMLQLAQQLYALSELDA